MYIPVDLMGATNLNTAVLAAMVLGTVGFLLVVFPTPISLCTQTGFCSFRLTMSAYPADNGSVSPATGYYKTFSSVTIKATPQSGYTFLRWTGTGTGSYTGNSQTATVIMRSDIQETAVFGPQAKPVAQPSISITPSSGPAGTVIQVTGTGFQPGPVTIKLPDPQPVWTATASQTGTFSTTITLAGGYSGPISLTVTAYQNNGAVVATATFSDTSGGRAITISPASGPVSTTVTLTGTNFAPGAVTVDFGNTLVTTATAALVGTFTTSFPVPQIGTSEYTGTVEVTATDSYGASGSAAFTITSSSGCSGVVCGTSCCPSGDTCSGNTCVVGCSGTICRGACCPAGSVCTSSGTCAT